MAAERLQVVYASLPYPFAGALPGGQGAIVQPVNYLWGKTGFVGSWHV